MSNHDENQAQGFTFPFEIILSADPLNITQVRFDFSKIIFPNENNCKTDLKVSSQV